MKKLGNPRDVKVKNFLTFNTEVEPSFKLYYSKYLKAPSSDDGSVFGQQRFQTPTK